MILGVDWWHKLGKEAYILESQRVDMILGVDWSHKLGKVMFDWK